MQKSIIIIAILALVLAGCAQTTPDVVCNSPYIRYASSCCMDRNANGVCDNDEENKPLFAEPDYAEELPDVTSTPVAEPVYQEQVDEEPVYETPKQEVADTETKSAYTSGPVAPKFTASEAKLQGWKAENSYMSLEVKSITIDVNDIEKTSLIAPDKEAYLKEIQLEVRNLDYNYLNPSIYIKLGDSKDPITIKETLLCDASDDIVMQGCINALPEGETMLVTMIINRKIPRTDLDKTILISLENKRDDIHPENIIEISKSYNILNIYGAKYV